MDDPEGPIEEREHLWCWSVDCPAMVGLHCSIETFDGFFREGKITRVLTAETTLDVTGIKATSLITPLGIELNDDSLDVIEFSRMKSLRIRI